LRNPADGQIMYVGNTFNFGVDPTQDGQMAKTLPCLWR